MIRKGLLAACASAALAFAGCGSSNKALSYSEFGKKASEVCQKTSADIKPDSAKLTGKASKDAPLYDSFIPKLQAAADKLKALKPPEQLKPDADKFNALTTEQIDAAKQAQTAAKAGDQTGYDAALKSAQTASEEANTEASKLGATDCAKSS